MNRSHLNIHLNALVSIAIFLLIILISACNPTKYIADGESLLDIININIDKHEVKKNNLKPYIKQTPNKRIFGMRFHLGLYNMSNIEKESWPHGWLRRIGEEPVVFDQYSASTSSEQLGNYLFSKGFFKSVVQLDYSERRKRTHVSYNIISGPAYIINNVEYNVLDTVIRKFVYLDSVNCLIERGKTYDVDVLQAERLRVERLIKDMGFYGFSRSDISFKIDSAKGNLGLDIQYNIALEKTYDENNQLQEINHKRYRIKDVFIYPDFNQRAAIDQAEMYFTSLDTIKYRDYNFVTNLKSTSVKKEVILQSMYIKPGDLFQITNSERSKSHLSSKEAFGRVIIRYKEAEPIEINHRGEKLINCIVQISPNIKQSYNIGLEGTNSAGNLGAALNLSYQHKNLFRGAEKLNIKLQGSYEALNNEIYNRRSTQEYGIDADLTLPKFLFPFLKRDRFIKKYNPKTTIKASFNYQNMPVYTRTVANAAFGYNWRSGNYIKHRINPIQFNIVNLPDIRPDFAEDIKTSSYLTSSYRDKLILGGDYSYTFNNQSINRAKSYWYIKFNGELAGNIISSIMSVFGQKKVDGTYKLFDQSFSQYIRGELDIRYGRNLNNLSSIIYRSLIGVGLPYGNSVGMPFEKQYFGGGANSLRGWKVRSLGPGSYIHTGPQYFNSLADIKLEFNVEYRYKLFWVIEGALFVDAGNIWTYNKDENRPGANFSTSEFYKQLALGTGLGLRFDIKIITLRTDLGIKLRDPQLEGGPDWIIKHRSLNWKDDFNLSISIGYPF